MSNCFTGLLWWYVECDRSQGFGEGIPEAG